MQSLRSVFLITSVILHIVIVPGWANVEKITDEAQNIYEKYQDNVYKVRVIDLATGKQAATGSGFRFSEEGYIVTNYHVLSDAILNPQRYRVEYVRSGYEPAQLTIIDFDIIHDIAVTQSEEAPGSYFRPHDGPLSKGMKIFSLGNLHDLGITIVEGLYNGLMSDSMYQKILFTGSLNPGMSGGPALNRDGEVIGINVATAGNQVSFLVPVKFLNDLYQRVKAKPAETAADTNTASESSPKVGKNNSQSTTDWNSYIEKQLLANQNEYMDKIFETNWETLPIGDAVVPGEISKVFKCWGDSEDEPEKLYTFAEMQCSTADQIFLSSTLYTGEIHYQYNWLTSKGLNQARFYNFYRTNFSYPSSYQNAGKEDVTNFKCKTEFINIGKKDWRAAFCTRRYKKYPQIYDIHLTIASVNERHKGLLIEVIALGLNQEKALQFAKKFMEHIVWQKSSLK